MYENYLLHAGAITDLLNNADHASQMKYKESDVQDALVRKLQDSKYFKAVPAELRQNEPAAWVHAAEVLRDLFSELTAQRPQIFDKTTHAVRITEWLLEHDPSHLTEIVELLQNALGPESAESI